MLHYLKTLHFIIAILEFALWKGCRLTSEGQRSRSISFMHGMTAIMYPGGQNHVEKSSTLKGHPK